MTRTLGILTNLGPFWALHPFWWSNIYINKNIYIYIYIYTERDIDIDIYLYIYLYIYIYVHAYLWWGMTSYNMCYVFFRIVWAWSTIRCLFNPSTWMHPRLDRMELKSISWLEAAARFSPGRHWPGDLNWAFQRSGSRGGMECLLLWDVNDFC